MRLISQIDRDRIGGQMTRWVNALNSRAWARMTHEEAYDVVYGTTMHPDHKQDRLENIARITG